MFFNESHTLSPTLNASLGCLDLLACRSYSSYTTAIAACAYSVASLRRLTKLSPSTRGLSLIGLSTSYIGLMLYLCIKKKGLIPIKAAIWLLIVIVLV